jgi:hypothetical protein
MDIFLKAKHWQIFLVSFGLPSLIEIIAMPFMILGNNPAIILKIMPILMFFFAGGFFGWIWAIATGLQSKVPTGIIMKVKKFKIFFFIPIVYLLLIVVFMGKMMGGMPDMPEPSGATIGLIMAIVFPLHIISMFGIFYSFYFAAKTYKTVELQREVSFSDFAGEFFLIWFYPVGVWIVQPKINQMIEGTNPVDAGTAL